MMTSRRDLLVGSLAAAAGSMTAASAHAAKDPNTRSVFKVIPAKSEVTRVVKILGPEPSAETMEDLRYQLDSALWHDRNASIVTADDRLQIKVVPSFCLVQTSFPALEVGDLFVMYEETGEIVFAIDMHENKHCVWVAESKASRLESGVFSLQADAASIDRAPDSWLIPETCPTKG